MELDVSLSLVCHMTVKIIYNCEVSIVGQHYWPLDNNILLMIIPAMSYNTQGIEEIQAKKR